MIGYRDELVRSFVIALALVLTAFGCERAGGEIVEEPIVAPSQPVEPAPAKAKAAPEVERAGLAPGTDEQQRLLVKAKGAFLNNQPDEAEKRFTELVSTGPVTAPQVTAYIALGSLYEDSGRTGKAMELYEGLLGKAPDVAEVHFVVARTYLRAGKTELAIKAYERALSLDQDYVAVFYELAGIYAESGKKEEAQKLFLEYERRIYGLAARLEKSDGDPQDQLHVLEVFSYINDDRANQAIVRALGNPHPSVRESAVVLVEELALSAARERLQKMMIADPDQRVRIAARAAVRSIPEGAPTGVKPTVVAPPASEPGKKPPSATEKK